MDLGAVVLQIRGAATRFGNNVMGAAELALAQEFPLKEDSAFVIPIADAAPVNQGDSSINQVMTERIGVIAVMSNVSKKDLLGFDNYSLVDTVRNQLFVALLGWQCPGTESLMYYAGGKLIAFDTAWFWYQFEFEAQTRLQEKYDPGAGALPYLTEMFSQWKVGGDNILPLPEDSPLPTDLLSDPVLEDVIELPAGYSPAAFSSGFRTAPGVLNKKNGDE